MGANKYSVFYSPFPRYSPALSTMPLEAFENYHYVLNFLFSVWNS